MIIALMLSGAAPAVAAISTQHPGGGTWVVGTRTGWFTKDVVSHYYHKTKFHSATAEMFTSSKRVYKDAGQWANADVTGLRLAAGKAYWSTP